MPPQMRDSALSLRGIAIRRPLQGHVDARAFLEYEELVRADLELAHAARKVFVAGQPVSTSAPAREYVEWPEM